MPPIYLRHVPKNVLLILLSLVTLPISITLIAFSLLITKLNPPPRPLTPHNGNSPRKIILVTGVSMTKGLTIARLLSLHTPHRIIGADTSPFSSGRFSRSLSAFYQLTPPTGKDAQRYTDSLLDVMRMEGVNLWISCSSVIAAVEDGEMVRLAEKQMAEMGNEFKAVQFKKDVVERLHEKDRFIEYMRSLGLTVPESHRCTSSSEVHMAMYPRDRNAEAEVQKKYLLKPIGVDDRARGLMMTLLPFETQKETTRYIEALDISPSNPFQLQQFIPGSEYCTHALIVRGRVTAFVACPSSDMLMHYEALPRDSRLSKEMLAFTETVAEDGGPEFTGHLSFDFLAEGEGEDVELFPIECNPRAHTAVALFEETPQMAGAYLSVFESDATLQARNVVVPNPSTPRYSWIGHDLVTLLLLPLLNLLWDRAGFAEVVDGVVEFGEYLLGWRDGTFAMWDPVPFLVLYHVYWPVRFLECLVRGREWSRVNVSTTKVFEC